MQIRRSGAVRGLGGALLWLLGTTAVAPLADGTPVVGLAQFLINNSPGAVATTAIETLGKSAQPVLVASTVLGVLFGSAVVGAYWSSSPLGEWGWQILVAPVVVVFTAGLFLYVGVPSIARLILVTALGVAPALLYGWVVEGDVSIPGTTDGKGRRSLLENVGVGVLGVVGIGAASRAAAVTLSTGENEDGTIELGSIDGGREDTGGDGGSTTSNDGGIEQQAPQGGEDAATEPLTPQEQKEETGRTVRATATATRQATVELQHKNRVHNVTVSVATGGGQFGFDFAGMPKPVTPVGSHYVVDKNINDPDIDRDSWSLSMTGAAKEPYELSFEDLLGNENRVQQTVTMVCISNKVGDKLISTGRWRGIPLKTLVERAAPKSNVRDVVTKAADGYDEAIPWDYVKNHPEVLVAYGLNGETLSKAHGDPARLLIPGRYGMRSTKWLDEIELKTTEHDAFWERNGWDEEAVIHTLSYLRAIQRRGDRVAVGGVAYAGLRGIDGVEVSYDGGETWVDAILEKKPGEYAWHRWRAVEEVPRGQMEIVTRAIDGTGTLQTKERTPPHPAGSTGWHRKTITV